MGITWNTLDDGCKMTSFS